MKIAVIYNRSEIRDSDVINVFGMQTKERYSTQIVEMVASSLEKGGHNVRIIEGNMHVIDELQTFMPRVVRGEHPGLVFNMAYGIQGQYRYTHIPSMLEMLGIPYVGSSPAGHAIALDKVMSKIVFSRNDLPTPAFWVFSNSNENLSDVHYPAIVKPRMEAVSFGLRVVHAENELKEAIDLITKEYEQQVLAEEFIPGREFGVALLGNGAQCEALPIVEIDLEGDPDAIQTVDDKMKASRRKVCPAEVQTETSNELIRLARGAFAALGLSDFARVDFRMDTKGHLHILEINSMASLNLTGSYVLAARTAGMDFTDLVNRILDVAAIRYFGESYIATNDKDAKSSKKAIPLHVRIRSHLRSNASTIVTHLEQMVSINSYVHNIEGVNTLGHWISNRFQHLGFQRQIFPQTEVGNILYFSNHNAPFCDILILGHMDTVYDYQNYVPFHQERGKIYGSGVAESKGGLAIVIAALQALRFARVLRNIRCGVFLTPDDCLGGRLSKKLITEYGQNSKCVLGMKYGGLNGGIVTSCSGAQHYQIEISNLKNSRNKHNLNVIENVSQKILQWQKLSSPEKGVVVAINSLRGQTNPGSSSDHAIVSLTARFDAKSQSDELDEQIRKIAYRGTNGGLQVRINQGEKRCPVPESETANKFFYKVSQLAKILEVHVEPIHRDTSSDICHVPENVPVLGGFGPLGGDPQSPNEFIVSDSLIDRAALLALVIYDATH
jgi:D-alanine-D-alanine ligase